MPKAYTRAKLENFKIEFCFLKFNPTLGENNMYEEITVYCHFTDIDYLYEFSQKYHVGITMIIDYN